LYCVGAGLRWRFGNGVNWWGAECEQARAIGSSAEDGDLCREVAEDREVLSTADRRLIT
jgi:hypothetical protein